MNNPKISSFITQLVTLRSSRRIAGELVEIPRSITQLGYTQWEERSEGVPQQDETRYYSEDYGGNVRRSAAKKLVKIGHPAILALLEALKDESHYIRTNAALVIVEIDSALAAPAIPALIEALTDIDYEVHGPAARALVKVGVSAVPALIEALTGKDWEVRRKVAEVLGKIGDASAVPALIKVLKDEKDYVRQQAVIALGEIGHPSAIPALIESLGNTGYRHNSDDVAVEALVKIGVSAVPALIDALKDKNRLYYAAWALGQIGNVLAVPALIECFNWNKHWAAEALSRIGNSKTLPRKILADSRFLPEERSNILDRLRGIRYHASSVNVRYNFQDTRKLCERVLKENNAESRVGAQEVLNWLNRDHKMLLRSAQSDTVTAPQKLVRAYEGSPLETQQETLMRASDEPNESAEPPVSQPTLWQRIMGKQKNAA